MNLTIPEKFRDGSPSKGFTFGFPFFGNDRAVYRALRAAQAGRTRSDWSEGDELSRVSMVVSDIVKKRMNWPNPFFHKDDMLSAIFFDPHFRSLASEETVREIEARFEVNLTQLCKPGNASRMQYRDLVAAVASTARSGNGEFLPHLRLPLLVHDPHPLEIFLSGITGAKIRGHKKMRAMQKLRSPSCLALWPEDDSVLAIRDVVIKGLREEMGWKSEAFLPDDWFAYLLFDPRALDPDTMYMTLYLCEEFEQVDIGDDWYDNTFLDFVLLIRDASKKRADTPVSPEQTEENGEGCNK